MSNRKEKPLVSRGFVCLVGFLLIFGTVLLVRPHFIKARNTSAAYACINQLGQIDAAANEFALEHKLTNGTPINFPSDLTPFITLDSAGRIPKCPQGGTYSIKRVGDTPTCSLGTNVIPAHVLP
jgi:hypothetical protein